MLRALVTVILMAAMLAIAALAFTPLGVMLALKASEPWRSVPCHPVLVGWWLPWQGMSIDSGCVP